MNPSSSLKVSNSDESEFLTKSFILIWPLALFFCFTLLFFWVFSLFPSLSPSQPIRVSSIWPSIRLAITAESARCHRQMVRRTRRFCSMNSTISSYRWACLKSFAMYTFSSRAKGVIAFVFDWWSDLFMWVSDCRIGGLMWLDRWVSDLFTYC